MGPYLLATVLILMGLYSIFAKKNLVKIVIGTIIIEYEPRKSCLELKSLKHYLLEYRNLGIFYENAVNRILADIVAATRPVWCVVRGEFTARGGLTTTVEARWPRYTEKRSPGRAAR